MWRLDRLGRSLRDLIDLVNQFEARGRKGGRPKALDPTRCALAVQLYLDKEHSVKEICERMSISKPTLYKYVEATGAGDTPSRP